VQILLLGFGPFPGVPRNPSACLVKALGRRRRPALAQLVCRTHVFATRYAAVDRDLLRLLAEGPDIVLMFGLAGRSRELRIETRARNAVSTLLPDAGGQRPAYRWIARGGPSALRSRAPVGRLQGALRGSRVAARLSRDAGSYLCNYAYWRALESAGNGRPLVQFIHIPRPSATWQPRRRGHRRRPTLALLVFAAERLLVALAASRH
jgi:pyroglutamyl-peptidase